MKRLFTIVLLLVAISCTPEQDRHLQLDVTCDACVVHARMINGTTETSQIDTVYLFQSIDYSMCDTFCFTIEKPIQQTNHTIWVLTEQPSNTILTQGVRGGNVCSQWY